MAVIQKIRNKYAKLAGFVIALSLVGFILMDAASGRFGSLFGNDSSVAEVNGEKIDSKDYSQRVNDYKVLYNYSSQGRPMDDMTTAQINDQALRELVNEKLIMDEAEKLGLESTKEEEKELIYGANPDPIVRQYPVFTNEETRMFDPQRIKMFEQQVDQIDPTGKMKEEWETLKAYVLRNNKVKKYNALLQKSVYMPDYLVKQQMKEQGSQASIRYVKVPFSVINDNEVKTTDDDLKGYMKKHESLYRIEEPTRSIEYVSFDVTPSAEDTSKSLGTLQNLKNEFAGQTDVESFVNRNSDNQYTDVYVSKKTFMSPYTDTIMNMPVGSVFGPYYDNGTYKLTKIVDKKIFPDSVKCRHILIKSQERGQMIVADSVAKKRIDSVVAAINAGASFDTMVVKVSQDDGSIKNGGEYTFTLEQKAQLSKEFGDFAFEGRTGEKKVVKVENASYAGYHYIEIMSQTGSSPAAKLATVTKSLFPGDNTQNATYAKASEFAGQNNKAKLFDEAVKKNNLPKKMADNVKVNDFLISGLGSGREIIRWMYDAKVGDVSPVFQLEGRYAVAKLSAIKQKGIMELDDNIRPAIEAAVRSEKKAKLLADKYKSATSLEAVAQASSQTVQQADSFNASQPFIPNIGYEPKVVGYSFYSGFKPSTVSPIIKGQDGIFFINLIGRYDKAMPIDDMVIAQMKTMQGSQMRNVIVSGIEEMNRKSANVKYNSKNL